MRDLRSWKREVMGEERKFMTQMKGKMVGENEKSTRVPECAGKSN